MRKCSDTRKATERPAAYRGDMSTVRRASSFGSQAAAYAAERPGYPDGAVAWALEPVRHRTPLRVLDLAAGTGKLTSGILGHTRDVVAVEPDAAMLAELRKALPGVRALAGAAERIPLEDGSVDAVLVGQALHWFDLQAAMPEMARVLAQGGVVAGLWNRDDDDVPWVDGLKRASGRGVSYTRRTAQRKLEATPDFPVFAYKEFAHAWRRTAESMTATIGTHSHVLVLGDDERKALLENVLDYLKSRPETARGEFELPISTLVARSVRV